MTPAREGAVEEEPTLSYEYAPGTEGELAELLAVLSLFVPEEDDDGEP